MYDLKYESEEVVISCATCYWDITSALNESTLLKAEHTINYIQGLRLLFLRRHRFLKRTAAPLKDTGAYHADLRSVNNQLEQRSVCSITTPGVALYPQGVFVKQAWCHLVVEGIYVGEVGEVVPQRQPPPAGSGVCSEFNNVFLLAAFSNKDRT